MKNILLVFALMLFQLYGFAQMQQPPDWSYSFSKKEVNTGAEVELIFKARIPANWYLYSSDFDPDLGPMITEFSFNEHESFELVGEIKPINPRKKYEEVWEGEVTYFTGTAEFRQTVKIPQNKPEISGNISYQICSDVSGQCIPFDTDFRFNAENIQVVSNEQNKSKPNESIAPTDAEKKKTEKRDIRENLEDTPSPEIDENIDQGDDASSSVGSTEPSNDETNPDKSTPSAATEGEIPVKGLKPFANPFSAEMPEEENTAAALLAFFLISFGAGLAALLTPCIFPMIPMTVTFFTKASPTRAKGISNAVVYGLSIVVIYTLIGTVFALLFGAEFANWLSTHWIPNVFFFGIFFVFALAFFGLFEITLPSGVVNSIDKRADKGGYVGIFFMAFTLVLVGFSCTGPIVGTILIGAAQGEAIKPIIGMLGFSIAFAIPFTLFAIFPGWLSSLPKSGGWLNSVKVVLGFLELALGLKFLSVADQVYHWGILDREVYLALWIIIFTLMGFYLLGKIRLPHDSAVHHTSVPRLMLAIITFGFVMYLIPGLVGAPLKALAGYLPPMSTHDFNLVAILKGEERSELPAVCEEPKYNDLLHLPHGLSGYYDYEQALACAREQNKPIFIDFTGHGCVNCREMEANVWGDPEVLRRLREDYVVVALYVDEKTELPEDQWYISAYDNKIKKSMGKQNLDFMIQKLNANAQPYYTLISPDEVMLALPKGYDLKVTNFVEFLDMGKKRHQELTTAQN